MGHMFAFGCTHTYKNTALAEINMLFHLNTYELHFHWANLKAMNFNLLTVLTGNLLILAHPAGFV